MADTETLRIRPAHRDDLRAVLRLLVDDDLGAGREDLSEPLDPGYAAAFDAIEAHPDQILAVMERDGAVIGCLQLSILANISRRGAPRGLIENVRIASALRGQGLGARLVEWAVDICRARRCALVQLTSDNSRTAAHRFYERLGFEKSHVGMKLGLD